MKGALIQLKSGRVGAVATVAKLSKSNLWVETPVLVIKLLTKANEKLIDDSFGTPLVVDRFAAAHEDTYPVSDGSGVVHVWDLVIVKPRSDAPCAEIRGARPKT